ncbi:MAG: RluA family pseudouridine synthase [Dehalococcoidia bacterium]|nr:RluA family pseudouridine synthase [Dehalococcoidia bacterium]
MAQGGQRLDQFLAAQGLELTRSQVQRLIEEGHVQLNGQPARPAQRVKPADRVTLTIPPPRTLDLVPQAMPLTVVYQDAELLVVDKPAGLAVHPGPGHPDRTLVNALLALCPDLPGVGGAVRPGIVHRLDKDTSGLMVVAKTHRAHLALSAQIKDRQVTKGYLALGVGHLDSPQGVVDAPIARDPHHRQRMAVVLGGREARTRYWVVERLAGRSPSAEGHSLLEMYLETGRTHQIRVHLAYLGHPLLGDAVYGKASPLLARQFLHACHLAFQHPVTGQALDFRAPLPEDLQGVLEQLGSRYAAAPVA